MVHYWDITGKNADGNGRSEEVYALNISLWAEASYGNVLFAC